MVAGYRRLPLAAADITSDIESERLATSIVAYSFYRCHITWVAPPDTYSSWLVTITPIMRDYRRQGRLRDNRRYSAMMGQDWAWRYAIITNIIMAAVEI